MQEKARSLIDFVQTQGKKVLDSAFSLHRITECKYILQIISSNNPLI